MKQNKKENEVNNNAYILLKIYMLIFFCFLALLTGSTGSIIVNIINETKTTVSLASTLPISRYIACILAGFFISPQVIKIGYKNSINISLLFILFTCILVAINPTFIITCFFFFSLGLGYTLSKTALFSAISLIFNTKKSHVSFISLMEGIYMTGVMLSFLLFSCSNYLGNWLYALYLLIILIIILFFITNKIEIPECKIVESNSIKSNINNKSIQLLLLYKFPIVIYFTLSFFAYVILERGISDWLPTYNYFIFHVEMSKSILIAGIFSASIALGRLLFSLAVHYIDCNKLILIFTCTSLFITLILGFFDEVIPGATITQWSKISHTVFILPMVGFFIGPVCPLLYSSLLITFNNKEQSKITGLIIVVSGIGSIIGTYTTSTIINMLAKSLVLEFLSTITIVMIIFLLFFLKKYSTVTQNKN